MKKTHWKKINAEAADGLVAGKYSPDEVLAAWETLSAKIDKRVIMLRFVAVALAESEVGSPAARRRFSSDEEDAALR